MSLILWTQEFAGRDAVELVFQVTTQPGGDTDTVRILVRDAGLIGPVNLVIDNASHGHVVEEPTLSLIYNLLIQDANQTHTIDNIDLTQLHQLVVFDTAHNHLADNLTIEQIHNLLIADALHSHTAQQLELEQWFVSGEAEVELDDPADPEVHTNHNLTIRARTVEGGGTLTFKLVQGTTTIATFNDTLTDTFQNYVGTLSEAEAANITDYTDLRVRWQVTHSEEVTPQVSWIEFSVPESPILPTYRPWLGANPEFDYRFPIFFESGRIWVGGGPRPRNTGKTYVGR